MKRQLLHTPEGARDIYNDECEKKLILQDELLKVQKQYGYHPIQTPTFEFFDTFGREIGTTPSKDLYKFFDREGDTLALRPDITPSIARAAATLFETEDFPIRLCYVGSTFINHSSYQGRLKESTQLGAELIGIDSVEADAEMIAMVVDGLKKVGLKEFQVNIGHVDFLQSLMEATGLSKEQQEEIYNLIANRNFFGVEELLEQADASPELKETFRLLPEFAGDVDVLKKAVEHAPTDQAKQSVGRLLKIYKLLALYGADDYVTFDLSMSGHYGYYTGIVFRVYTYGTGASPGLSGGQSIEFEETASAIRERKLFTTELTLIQAVIRFVQQKMLNSLSLCLCSPVKGFPFGLKAEAKFAERSS